MNYNPNANIDNGSCDYEIFYECPTLDFTYYNTGVNMTIIFDTTFVESHNIQSGQMIGVFADVDQTPICYGSSEWTGEQFSIAVWGDDTSTPEVDGFQFNDTINIGYQLPDGTIMGLELSPILYVTNSINVISNGTFSTVCSTLAVSGCTDNSACNYDSLATFVESDGSNAYIYCLWLTDGDGCDVIMMY